MRRFSELLNDVAAAAAAVLNWFCKHDGCELSHVTMYTCAEEKRQNWTDRQTFVLCSVVGVIRARENAVFFGLRSNVARPAYEDQRAICSAVVSRFVRFIFKNTLNDFCQTNHLKIYWTDLRQVGKFGRTMAVDDQSEFFDPLSDVAVATYFSSLYPQIEFR